MSKSDLTNKYAVAALKHRRATLAGEIAHLEAQAEWKRKQLIHLDQVLELFGSDPEKIKNKKYQRVSLFKQGELSQTVRDVLRRAGKPLRTTEVTDAVMKILGQDRLAYDAMAPRVRSSLEYLMTGKSTVRRIGNGQAAKWTLSS